MLSVYKGQAFGNARTRDRKLEGEFTQHGNLTSLQTIASGAWIEAVPDPWFSKDVPG
jgi:hypothetical protein